MSSPQPHITKQPPSPFLALPLELRETIYHHMFQSQRFLHASFPPRAPSTNPLTTPAYHLCDSLLRYRLDDTLGKPHSSIDHRTCNQLWLLTNKSIMHEALAHFARNAEWTFKGYHLWSRTQKRKCWATRLPLDARAVRRMELDVRNVQYWNDEPQREKRECRDIFRLAELLRDAHFSLYSLRFVGYAATLERDWKDVRYGREARIFANLRAVFSCLPSPAPHFSFGVTNDPWGAGSRWILYDYAEDTGTRLLVHERRRRVRDADPPAKQDLMNLLPEGWVLARKKCGDDECDTCFPEERETWVDFGMLAGEEWRWGGVDSECEGEL